LKDNICLVFNFIDKTIFSSIMNCSLSDTDIEAFLMTVSVILLINIRLYDTDLILQINQIFMEIKDTLILSLRVDN